MTTCVVRTGNTLTRTSIAERYGITVQDLVRESKVSRG